MPALLYFHTSCFSGFILPYSCLCLLLALAAVSFHVGFLYRTVSLLEESQMVGGVGLDTVAFRVRDDCNQSLGSVCLFVCFFTTQTIARTWVVRAISVSGIISTAPDLISILLNRVTHKVKPQASQKQTVVRTSSGCGRK